ncbi:hypothetical protein [Vreelandella massiliensis]|uniref:hypothetical protein n=1 Tax=Vreelandella massiliensis TaxID=1816686 RepID=UPI00096A525F|nr:hypothetical protein [Halomonas massiliensis]
MADHNSTINARIPTQMRDALEAIARERRMETGDAIRLADLVREALALYLSKAPTDSPEPAPISNEAFGTHVLDALEELEKEARRLGLEDSQELGMAVWRTATDDPRLEALRPFINRLNEAIKVA